MNLSEPVSLKNVRYVHITEPYWHPVRIEQVIGRARRICSHQDLPLSERNVKVFIYLMSFTQQQLDDEASVKLKLKDIVLASSFGFMLNVIGDLFNSKLLPVLCI